MTEEDIYEEFQLLLSRINDIEGVKPDVYLIRRDNWEIPASEAHVPYITWSYNTQYNGMADAGYTGVKEGDLDVVIYSSNKAKRKLCSQRLQTILKPDDKIYSGSVGNTVWVDNLIEQRVESVTGLKKAQSVPDVPGILFQFNAKVKNYAVH